MLSIREERGLNCNSGKAPRHRTDRRDVILCVIRHWLTLRAKTSFFHPSGYIQYRSRPRDTVYRYTLYQGWPSWVSVNRWMYHV